MTTSKHEYTRRIDRVIDYLRDNLDRPHRLDELARVACLSEFHFHRIFTNLTGETVNEFTNRLRLEKAARLLTESTLPLTGIALECGFSSSSTFSRSFRNAFHTTPSSYRRTGTVENSKIRKELFDEQAYILPMSEAEKRAAFPVEMRTFPDWNVAYIRVADAFRMDPVIAAFGRLIDWAKAQGILEGGVLFGMSIDDPSVTPKHLYRYEACLASEAPFECAEGISRMTMPGRTYAVTRAVGDLKYVATATEYLSRGWLLQSGYERDHAHGLEIFIDKEKALDWSSFDLELAVPVSKLKVI